MVRARTQAGEPSGGSATPWPGNAIGSGIAATLMRKRSCRRRWLPTILVIELSWRSSQRFRWLGCSRLEPDLWPHRLSAPRILSKEPQAPRVALLPVGAAEVQAASFNRPRQGAPIPGNSCNDRVTFALRRTPTAAARLGRRGRDPCAKNANCK